MARLAGPNATRGTRSQAPTAGLNMSHPRSQVEERTAVAVPQLERWRGNRWGQIHA